MWPGKSSASCKGQRAAGQNHHVLRKIWRRGQGLNSRIGYPISGFQDQRRNNPWMGKTLNLHVIRPWERFPL